MPYRYLDDIAIADVAFEATGKDLEEVFTSAAAATTHVMIEEPERIERKHKVYVRLANEEADMLLFDFLGELVYYKDAKKLLLLVDEIKITAGEAGYSLEAALSGEELDPAKHPLGADVKAVTLHRFSLVRTENGWRATAVLDI
jgi:SHS2 domain-containing protein